MAATAANLDGVRRRLIVLVLAVVLAGCGGYAGDNRTLVAQLPELDDVVLISEQEYGYCGGDTCVLRADRSATLLVYTVDTARYTKAAVVDAYRAALPDWTPEVIEGCGNADATGPDDPACVPRTTASFVLGDARIDLNFDKWPGGYEVHVDAMGAVA